MQIVFGRRVRTPPPGGYRTRLLRSGDQVITGAHVRHSRAKSYLKCARAFRIKTVVNDTGDLGWRWSAPCARGLHVVAGFTNRSLRAQVATLLGVPHSMGQMSYDLRRLRMMGLITVAAPVRHLRPDPGRAPSTPRCTTGSCDHWPRPATPSPAAPA